MIKTIRIKINMFYTVTVPIRLIHFVEVFAVIMEMLLGATVAADR